MSRLWKAISLSVVALFVAAGLAACSSSEPIDMSQVDAVIDVRTPAEYAEGHLEGAVNIDWQSPDFMTIVSQLPTDGTYVIYCRSGNRSAEAISAMEAEGFTNLTNAGGYADASKATGLPIVQ